MGDDDRDELDVYLEALMEDPSFRDAYVESERRAQAQRDAIRHEAENKAKQAPAMYSVTPPLSFRRFLWRERWLFLAAAVSFVAVSYGSSWLMVQLHAPYYARFLVGGAVGFLLYRTGYAILERRLRRWQ